MSNFYVLLDAMGIQRHIFATNNLRIIEGSSLSLSHWQKACRNRWPKNVICSAGGNILAVFTDEMKAQDFRVEAVERMAPPGMEIAWAQVEARENVHSTWSALQLEISRYKCGDRKISYPDTTPVGAPGCLHCGIRSSDGSTPIKGKRTCTVCRECYDASQNLRSPHAENSPIEKLYQLAISVGFPDAFPDELSQLVKCDDGEDDMLAVLVIDVNNLGSKVEEIVEKQGFLGLRIFSRTIEFSILKIWTALISELAKQEQTAIGGRFFRMRPLLMGGDDMVVALPARFWPRAVQFILRKLADRNLDACAGVMISKHTFPINRLVEMAEELVSNAKGFARYTRSDGNPEVSAIDWHIHQEAAYSTPLSARRNHYVRELKGHPIQCTTKKPYTLDEFGRLIQDGRELGQGLSSRKLRLLYASLREGPRSTRETLVYTFLRDETKGLRKYSQLWPLVEKVSCEFPLWNTHNVKGKKVYGTDMVDMFELTMTERRMES